MDRERWLSVKRLFEQALDLPAEKRTEWVAAQAGEDHDLERAVAKLLAAEATPNPGLEPPSPATLAGAPIPGSEPLAKGDCVGPFRVERRLATGGMGDVYLAHQSQPDRYVAIKVLSSMLPSERSLRRFELEAELLARLEHPAIARVFAVGHQPIADGSRVLPYFAMEYVRDARDVLGYSREHGLDRAQRIDLFLTLCGAIRFAHERGVLHRDLKPSNLLVDAGGHPMVIDFGIARMLDVEGDSATRTGEVFGTLGYLSPERLEGKTSLVDVRSDVYSLGVVLFELLAERRPHDLAERSLGEALAIVRDTEPRRPSEFVPGLPVELDWICLKALAPDRERRYGSVSELVSDLENLRRGAPITAGSPSTVYRFRRFLRRHRVATAVAATLALGLFGTAFGVGVGLERAQAERQSREVLHSLFTGIFEGANAARSGADLRVSDLLQQFSARYPSVLADSPEILASFHLASAEAWKSVRQPARSSEFAEAGLELCRSGKGDPVDHARLVLLLGRLAEDATNWQAALDLFDEASSLAARCRGDSEFAALRTDTTLARARSLHQLGQRAEAFAAVEEGLGFAREASQARSLAYGYWLKGFLHRRDRQFDSATDAYDQGLAALAELSSNHTGEHESLRISLLQEKSRLLGNEGRYTEAVELASTVLEAGDRWFGAYHPDHVPYRIHAAWSHAHLGDYATAAAGLEDLLTASRYVELQAQDLINIRTYLIQCDRSLGKTERALENSKKVIEDRSELFGEHHLSTLQDQMTLGSVLFAAERIDEGAATYRDVIADMRDHVEDPFYAADALARLSTLLFVHGRLEQALDIAEQADVELARLVEADHPALWQHRLMSVQLFHGQGRAELAATALSGMKAGLALREDELRSSQVEALHALLLNDGD